MTVGTIMFYIYLVGVGYILRYAVEQWAEWGTPWVRLNSLVLLPLIWPLVVSMCAADYIVDLFTRKE